MYLKAEKLVQVTTPLDSETAFTFESGYLFVDVLGVGSGGGGSFQGRGGSGGGSMFYLADADIKTIDDNTYTIPSPNKSSQTYYSYMVFGNNIQCGLNSTSRNGTQGPVISLSTNQTAVQPGSGGGGASASLTTQSAAGAQGGGVLGDGNSGIDNGVNENTPYTNGSSGSGESGNSGSGGEGWKYGSDRRGKIPLFALGGTGRGGFISMIGFPDSNNSIRWDIGGGGAGGYGDGGNGLCRGSSGQMAGSSSVDGGYGAGGGGGLGMTSYPAGDGGQGIVVLRYH